jgi:hypothetical protein
VYVSAVLRKNCVNPTDARAREQNLFGVAASTAEPERKFIEAWRQPQLQHIVLGVFIVLVFSYLYLDSSSRLVEFVL